MNLHDNPFGRSKHTANTYAIGNRVYGGSSGVSHATFGLVNPDGYVQREQRRRSGLAGGMLGSAQPQGQQQPARTLSQVSSLVSTHPYAVLAREVLARRARR